MCFVLCPENKEIIHAYNYLLQQLNQQPVISVMETLCVFSDVRTGKLSLTANRPQGKAHHSLYPVETL
jgi:hypothetical protein